MSDLLWAALGLLLAGSRWASKRREEEMSSMTPPKIKTEVSRITARELLVEVAGEDHATHSVVWKDPRPQRGTVAFKCSCGALCVAPATETNKLALKNVPMEAS